ncbi:conserved hypothetical protein [Renibacterium salmoninarum ATCC 33209]|uniref:Uncharacterized protein n=1 Tax=Renibacterium salmoninarum (strain ATCC 33209 / DSM 20767 / JCM 11484 / NBRC 15589 / NCIMB 2235) TaxID=288705 RepID=A9WUT9_RENSM|nr:hypothetical protein [Renibacterium salmoninarum]ABY24960.1 conserved hypothetical protein [Renibacterium salmoninarum ATCC 33209]
MLTQLVGAAVIAASEHEEPAPLFMPFWMFGVVAILVLLLLMFITMSFTNLGNRHEAHEEEPDPHRQHTNNHDHGEVKATSNH